MERPLDSTRPSRSVFPGEVDTAFWRRNIRHHCAELFRPGYHVCPLRVWVILPGPRRTSFEVIPHPRVDLLEEVQRPLDLSFFAHVRILHCEILVDVGHDNATLTRLIECRTPYVHCLVNRSKAVASIRFPETAIRLRVHTRHGSHAKVLDS